ncbi:MAG: signal recognition particle-docking protein FtsY [Pseudanabaenaceae cyanobacterium SKYGB_i_bin29]|nr:signal recognition particle-docking protein FtsY [Pseudanabaenaceae cyanobacterium SKYG29]MDW8421949.1 signal recognition particle-docking protein FtsY [Pseudanabaenaceae cyanobacterium SKYGB_i_bin29]
MFNWFQRPVSAPQVPQSDTSSEKAETPTSPPDLLEWAKQAYANIQSQSTAPVTPPESTSTAEQEETSTQGEEFPETGTPFWLQSEAERQARIAALAASAIVEPPPPVDNPQVAEPPPVIAFDDGFLWSAEVLAAQGRRPDDVSLEEITWLKRLRQGLTKTRLNLVNQLKALFGQGPLSPESVEEIENILLQADVGVATTDRIIAALQDKLRREVLPPEQAIAYLKQILRDILDQPFTKYPPRLYPQANQLNVWLVTGVNGAGKTTTIGKLAHLARKSGYRTLIAAADTFRAAAVDQLKIWGERAQVEVIANPAKNTDPAAVVFDALNAARARQTELLLVDTAGRLQNKKNLMEELKKIRRVVDKQTDGVIVESLLVLDTTLGQNGLKQAEVFTESAKITGIVLTKLDGTAKGGIALGVVDTLGLPIRFIGAGEGIEDLRPFCSYEFVEALLS